MRMTLTAIAVILAMYIGKLWQENITARSLPIGATAILIPDNVRKVIDSTNEWHSPMVLTVQKGVLVLEVEEQ